MRVPAKNLASDDEAILRDATRYRALFKHGFSVRFLGREYESKELADCAIDAVSLALGRAAEPIIRDEKKIEPPREPVSHAPAAGDSVILRSDLPAVLGVCSETVRRLMKANKLPPPDVDLSQRTRGWRLSTLRAAGINIPDAPDVIAPGRQGANAPP